MLNYIKIKFNIVKFREKKHNRNTKKKRRQIAIHQKE